VVVGVGGCLGGGGGVGVFGGGVVWVLLRRCPAIRVSPVGTTVVRPPESNAGECLV